MQPIAILAKALDDLLLEITGLRAAPAVKDLHGRHLRPGVDVLPRGHVFEQADAVARGVVGLGPTGNRSHQQILALQPGKGAERYENHHTD